MARKVTADFWLFPSNSDWSERPWVPVPALPANLLLKRSLPLSATTSLHPQNGRNKKLTNSGTGYAVMRRHIGRWRKSFEKVSRSNSFNYVVKMRMETSWLCIGLISSQHKHSFHEISLNPKYIVCHMDNNFDRGLLQLLVLGDPSLLPSSLILRSPFKLETMGNGISFHERVLHVCGKRVF